MTREEMWEEFENQLKREVHTPMTMSYDESVRLVELGIKEIVARWKERLEQEPCEDCISREDASDKIEEWAEGFEDGGYFSGESVADAIRACVGILYDLPSVNPQEPNKNEVILSNQEYRELLSSEYDNGYDKGFREALEQLEQEPILEVVTNGDRVKSMFPTVKETDCDRYIRLWFDDKYYAEYNKEWWDAPYKIEK